jgi:hypothetical protein
MNNLRKFSTVADYQAAQLNYPAVSWITATDGVYFDKTAPTPTFGGLTVYYDIEDPSLEITLFNGGGGSSSDGGDSSGGGGVLPTTMIVDGNSETPINTWRFETAGEHIVQYTFEDNAVPEAFLWNISYATEIIIGDDITTIHDGTENGNVFGDILDLTSVTIGSGVTYIGNDAFLNSSNLTSVTVNNDGVVSQYIPTLGSNVFDNTNNCPIYVPASAVDTYKTSTSSGWSTYANRIQAIQ